MTRLVSWESFLEMIPEYYYRFTKGIIEVYLLNPVSETATGRVVNCYDECCTRWGVTVECTAGKQVSIEVEREPIVALNLSGISMNTGNWVHGSRASYDNPVDNYIDFEDFVKRLSPYTNIPSQWHEGSMRDHWQDYLC